MATFANRGTTQATAVDPETVAPYHLAVAASVSSTVLVGRDAPLARLRQAFDLAQRGGARVVVLAGEAGIGKTRLLTEFAASIGDAPASVAIGGCLDLADGGPPFLPFVEALRRLVRDAPLEAREELLGPAGHELARLAPELSAELGWPIEDPASVDQGRLFELILALAIGLARRAPLVLAIEDAHWIDRSSRDLVTFLVRNLGRERVLLVLTWRTAHLARDAATTAWLGELLRAPNVERLELPRLDRADVASLVSVLRGGRITERLVERVWSRSDGLPFFVEELLSAPDSPAAPPTLVDMLAARLGQLSPAARELLGALAVAGRGVEEELLATVIERPAAEIRPALREALDRFVVELEPGSGAFRFRHALLREVAAADLLPGERRALHERFALTLAERLRLVERPGAGASAELAYHWDGADRPDEAYAATVRAAAAASLVAAHGQAHGLYERALQLLDRRTSPPDDRERIGLVRSASEEADLAGEYERAIDLMRQAVALADDLAAGADGADGSIADPELAGTLHGRLGYLLWLTGQPSAALDEHQLAVSLVPAEPPTEARARVLAGLGGAYFSLGRYAEARATCEAAVATGERAEVWTHEARARSMLGSSLVALGEVDAGIRELERSRDAAARAGPPEQLIAAHHNLALSLAEAGRPDDALREGLEAREVARAAGLERRFGLDPAALVADVLVRLGRWDEADAVVDEAAELDPSGQGTIFLGIVRARLDALRGRIDEARARFALVHELAGDELDLDVVAYLARGEAELELAAGRPGAALEIVERAGAALGDADEPFARPVWAIGIRAAAELAEGARASRDAPSVAGRATTADRLLARLPAPGAAVPETAGVWSALGRLERDRVDGRIEPESWRALADRFAALRNPFLVSYATLRAAEGELRARGIRADVGAALRDAHATAARLGAEPLRTEIEALARRARVPLGGAAEASMAPPALVPSAPVATRPPGRVDHGPSLSAREVEVLRLVADGRTNGEIAERLFITRKTAGVHVTHILDKLGVGNRVEAAMAAGRLGLLDDAGDAGDEADRP